MSEAHQKTHLKLESAENNRPSIHSISLQNYCERIKFCSFLVSNTMRLHQKGIPFTLIYEYFNVSPFDAPLPLNLCLSLWLCVCDFVFILKRLKLQSTRTLNNKTNDAVLSNLMEKAPNDVMFAFYPGFQ